VSLRRASQLLVLAALMLAPFGRIGMAEARYGPGMMTMHCAGQVPSGDVRGHPIGVDCLIACAAMAPQAAFAFAPPARPAKAVPAAKPALVLAGVRPDADPPPPRLS
jgi:hypothetical protein